MKRANKAALGVWLREAHGLEMDRGYEEIETKLRALGADIVREPD